VEWQPFKDFVRSLLPRNQPGWTDTWRPIKAGVFSVKTEDDAQTAYCTYQTSCLTTRLLTLKGSLTHGQVLGRELLVHYFDVSGPGAGKLVKCNCAAYFGTSGHSETRSSAMAQLEHWVGTQQLQQPQIAVSPQHQAVAPYPFPGTYPAPATYHLTPEATQPSGYYSTTPSMVVPPAFGYGQPSYGQAYPGQAAPMIDPRTGYPMYTRNDNGLSVNVSQGVIQSERRGVHITGLKGGVTRSDLKKLLGKAGNALQYDLHTDGVSNQPKAYAIAFFATSEEARHAIRYLNNYEYRGMKLKARAAKDLPTLEQPSPPVIVNGSTGYQVSSYSDSSRVATQHPPVVLATVLTMMLRSNVNPFDTAGARWA
jgi:RNA recognition motif. (a.k.a. RRM, RBD, or RNP domain)